MSWGEKSPEFNKWGEKPDGGKKKNNNWKIIQLGNKERKAIEVL